MPVPGKSSPFSNGSEGVAFMEAYCWRCYRYHVDNDDIPTANSCKIEKSMALHSFDNTCPWPDEIVQTETRWHHCPLFIDKNNYVRKTATSKPMQNQIELED